MTGLLVRDLSVAKSGISIIDDASFSAAAGRVVGVLGPNGAGKSTLLHAVLGLVTPRNGKVRFGDEDFLVLPRRFRARIASFVEQSEPSDTRLTAREVVGLGRLPFHSVLDRVSSAEDERIIDTALSDVGMSNFEGRSYHALSGGEQQRLQIGRALAQTPRLLVLDEPTNHLDIEGQLSLLRLLRRKAQEGLTVLMAIHDINLAAAFCDSVLVMKKGRIVASGAPGEVLTPALLHEVYRVHATVLTHPSAPHPVVVFSSDPSPPNDTD
jgi:iron complex transport system ATP-binding protein